MTVSDLIVKLHAMFPRAKDWLIAWSATFRAVLGGREGEDLRVAADRTLGAWAEAGCPKPAHFAANLPPMPEATGPRAAPAWEKRDRALRARAAELERAWSRELAAWFEAGKAEGWAWHLGTHLASLAAWCAQCEEHGRGLDESIGRFNAHDYRGGLAKRAPDALVDETDAAIFRGRKASQERVTRPSAAGLAFAVAGAWRRDRLRRRILEQARAA